MSQIERVPPVTAAIEQRNLEARLYMINHVFLPPELPQEDDRNECREWSLMEDVLIGLQRFRGLLPSDQQGLGLLDRCSDLMERMKRTRDQNGFLLKEILDAEVEKLGDGS